MKENYQTRVQGFRIVLVPFRMEHAAIYLQWMQDEFIKEMTASGELVMNTLSEAEEFCKSIFDNPDNCTFLIAEKTSSGEVKLVGDINFFLSKDETTNETHAEVNLMIAEADSRRKGLAKEAILLGARYVIEKHAVTVLRARISDENTASLNLFQSKLNWSIESHSDVFSETTLKQDVTAVYVASLASEAASYIVTEDYDQNKV